MDTEEKTEKLLAGKMKLLPGKRGNGRKRVHDKDEGLPLAFVLDGLNYYGPDKGGYYWGPGKDKYGRPQRRDNFRVN